MNKAHVITLLTSLSILVGKPHFIIETSVLNYFRVHKFKQRFNYCESKEENTV